MTWLSRRHTPCWAVAAALAIALVQLPEARAQVPAPGEAPDPPPSVDFRVAGDREQPAPAPAPEPTPTKTQAPGAAARGGPASGAEVLELGDYVVTGTRTKKRLLDAPIRTELIQAGEMRTYAPQTLADAIEFQTGVRVENNCQNCNFGQIRLLGLEGAYSQILVDSQPVISSLAQVYGVEQIPARMIERIEIVKGGGSALYGPGAVAGVVNVFPRVPTHTGGSFEARFESMDYRTDDFLLGGNVDYVTEDADTALTLYGQLNEVDGWDESRDGFTELAEREMMALGARGIRHLLERDASITLDYSRIFEDRRGGDRLSHPEFQAEIAEAVKSTRDNASLKWQHAPSERFDYRVTGAVAYMKRDTYYGAGGDPNAYGTTKNPLYVVDTQANVHFLAAGAHTISTGVQFSADSLEDRQPAYDRETDETYTNWGFYLQDDWQPTDQVEVLVGARLDKHSEVDDPIVSPRIALRWSPTDGLALRASCAMGFRAPQVFNEDLHIELAGGAGQVIRNDSGLDEESAITFNAGFELNLPLDVGAVYLEGNAFYTDLDDAFFVDETDDPATLDQQEFTRINRGGAEVYGFELNLGYKIADLLSIELGYVEQRALYDDRDDDFGKREFPRTPERYGVAKLTWSPIEGLELFAGLKYTGPMGVPHYAGFIPEDDYERSETFLILDVSIAKTFVVPGTDGHEARLTVGVKNVTNDFQDDFDEGPDRDAGYVYGPRAPQTFFFAFEYGF